MVYNTLWFLGIDLGTGSCKSVVIDEKADTLGLGFGIGEYAGSDACDRWQEQNPRELLQAAITSSINALARAGVNAGQCAGLSIGGALHSMLVLDSSGKPLTGVITWAAGRAVNQAEALRGKPIAARLYEQTGCPAHGMYPLYKIMWLRDCLNQALPDSADADGLSFEDVLALASRSPAGSGGVICLPGKENAALYQRIYPLYQRLYQDVSGSFAGIARLQQELAP